LQRRVEAIGTRYERRYQPVELRKISLDLQHAVIAAEDGRFYDHHGIDFAELAKVVDEDLEEGAVGRGASTITQQLIKNLFHTTHRSFVRKGIEFVLAPLAELILPKQRILELYLNVIEWGPGMYGAEAAARYHYGVSAAALTRDQAARVAAIIPSPVRRKPSRMNEYSAEIQIRMRQMGW
jgi:monofunctional biosynthetic peptidoglycan transglycosylase